MQTNNNVPILCECIDTRPAVISTQAGKKHVFVLELTAVQTGELITKYFNVEQSKSGYAANRNGDFAKLYRLTFGENPSRRFSKAQQLLGHFRGNRFWTTHKPAQLKNGKPYFKAIDIKPEKPLVKNEWTKTGQLIKKSRKKAGLQTSENGNEMETSRKLDGNFVETLEKKDGNSKTLKTHIMPGLEPILNPINHLPYQAEPYYTYPPIEAQIFYHTKKPNESLDEYFDRVIDSTTTWLEN